MEWRYYRDILGMEFVYDEGIADLYQLGMFFEWDTTQLRAILMKNVMMN